MAQFRKINTEEYVGGRGHVTGHARAEKRRGGRVKCSAMTGELGTVEDLSACGGEVPCKKRPANQVGDVRDITLTAEGEEHTVRGLCVWVRVDDNCEFDMGWELPEVDAATKRRLMELAATAQASEGMTRGWSPMKWWRKAG